MNGGDNKNSILTKGQNKCIIKTEKRQDLERLCQVSCYKKITSHFSNWGRYFFMNATIIIISIKTITIKFKSIKTTSHWAYRLTYCPCPRVCIGGITARRFWSCLIGNIRQDNYRTKTYEMQHIFASASRMAASLSAWATSRRSEQK